jgi:hypothetical protein
MKFTADTLSHCTSQLNLQQVCSSFSPRNHQLYMIQPWLMMKGQSFVSEENKEPLKMKQNLIP